MKQYTLRNANGETRTVASSKEMVFLASRGFKVIEARWV